MKMLAKRNSETWKRRMEAANAAKGFMTPDCIYVDGAPVVGARSPLELRFNQQTTTVTKP